MRKLDFKLSESLWNRFKTILLDQEMDFEKKSHRKFLIFARNFPVLKTSPTVFLGNLVFPDGPVGSGDWRKSSERNEKVRVLWAPTELDAHILGF